VKLDPKARRVGGGERVRSGLRRATAASLPAAADRDQTRPRNHRGKITDDAVVTFKIKGDELVADGLSAVE
jgi:hypothetical protein